MSIENPMTFTIHVTLELLHLFWYLNVVSNSLTSFFCLFILKDCHIDMTRIIKLNIVTTYFYVTFQLLFLLYNHAYYSPKI